MELWLVAKRCFWWAVGLWVVGFFIPNPKTIENKWVRIFVFLFDKYIGFFYYVFGLAAGFFGILGYFGKQLAENS